MTTPAARHRRTLAAVCVTLAIMGLLVLAGMACFAWGQATERGNREAAQADQAEQDNKVTGCVSSYRAEFVDLPLVLALRAIQQGNDQALADAVNGARIEEYQQLLALRQTDPVGFLEQCATDGRDGG